jgi:CRISPR-associated protein Csb1
MTVDLSPLANVQRVLFEIPLVPMQGHRFQPTGFPGLGAATFQTSNGTCVLVESAQSMANRLELTCWDEARQDLKEEMEGLSHVRVLRNGDFLTDTILESHRLNSPYLLENSDKSFFNMFKSELGVSEVGRIDRRKLAQVLLKYDIGSLLHGVFLAKKELKGGQLRVSRALSGFIEADDVRIAASGGVKNDHVHPGKVEGDSKNLFGNVPFARDEFTAERIALYANLDLTQIRGYGLGTDAENLLILLALFKLRALVDGNLRLRTACDLRATDESIPGTAPKGFNLPVLADLTEALKPLIAACRDRMTVTEVSFNDELKKGKDEEVGADDDKPGENEG